ncbi:MAG: type II toxin-antitoxin system HicA family toxin [Rhodospirillaceae bacterium]|nr:type II toxin-antitoxin system HicA family toxin [Rhodospirillaceae bacterium]
MTKIYSSRELIKLLTADGWQHVRTTGDHHHFQHPTKVGTVTVPHPKKTLKRGTQNAILKAAGLK